MPCSCTPDVLALRRFGVGWAGLLVESAPAPVPCLSLALGVFDFRGGDVVAKYGEGGGGSFAGDALKRTWRVACGPAVAALSNLAAGRAVRLSVGSWRAGERCRCLRAGDFAVTTFLRRVLAGEHRYQQDETVLTDTNSSTSAANLVASYDQEQVSRPPAARRSWFLEVE